MKRESDIINLPIRALCCLICMGVGGMAADTVSDSVSALKFASLSK